MTIGVVAHDAGGAEMISSYLRRNGLPFRTHLEGAARGVFKRKFGTLDDVSLQTLVDTSEWLLCGTSFLSPLEWSALKVARQAGKRTVTVIDHWVNYRQRFLRNDEWHFPNEIWVGDEVALSLARQDVPEVPVKLVPNAYFLDLRDELEALGLRLRRAGEGLRILYVCEPLREDGIALHNDERYWGYTEEDALRYFMAHVGNFAELIERIVVRAHPQEARDKYSWVLDEFDLPIVTDEDKTLLQQVAESDIVVGCASMAMVVGLIAGRRVFSAIPPGGKTIPLPHPDIERLEALMPADVPEC
jgi:hypothetical protein